MFPAFFIVAVRFLLLIQPPQLFLVLRVVRIGTGRLGRGHLSCAPRRDYILLVNQPYSAWLSAIHQAASPIDIDGHFDINQMVPTVFMRKTSFSGRSGCKTAVVNIRRTDWGIV